MRILFIILVVGILAGCGAPAQYHDYRDHEYSQPQEEPLRFSNDSLLDSVYRARYLECLKNCADGEACK